MTVRELAEKLSHYKYQDAEIDIGCNSDYGHCLYAHIGPDDDNVFMCEYPENCGYYIMTADEKISKFLEICREAKKIDEEKKMEMHTKLNELDDKCFDGPDLYDSDAKDLEN